MPKSLTGIWLHITFHIKEGSFIQPHDTKELYAYIGGIIKLNQCIPVRIGGMPDHIHILCSLSRNITVAKLVEEIKRNSSRWIKTIDPFYSHFAWQRGYGAFSVSASAKQKTMEYINKQQIHHAKRTFQEELELFLKKYEVEYDEQYLWKD